MEVLGRFLRPGGRPLRRGVVGEGWLGGEGRLRGLRWVGWAGRGGWVDIAVLEVAAVV